MRSKGSTFLLITIFVLILLFLGYITVMYLLHPAAASPIVKGKLMDPGFHLGIWRLFFYPHILLGTTALITGAFQLSPANRKNRKRHKLLGKIYAGSVFINVLIVPYLTLYATGGRGSGVSFMVLDAFWLWTTGMGIWRIYRYDVKSHREWILRSYAVTWVFVTFRFLLPICQILIGLKPGWAFPISVYSAIALNLLITGVYIRSRQKRTELVLNR